MFLTWRTSISDVMSAPGKGEDVVDDTRDTAKGVRALGSPRCLSSGDEVLAENKQARQRRREGSGREPRRRPEGVRGWFICVAPFLEPEACATRHRRVARTTPAGRLLPPSRRAEGFFSEAEVEARAHTVVVGSSGQTDCASATTVLSPPYSSCLSPDDGFRGERGAWLLWSLIRSVAGSDTVIIPRSN